VTAFERWRYFAYDINTNSRLCELPARGVSFDSRLNDAGSWSGQLDLANPAVGAQIGAILSYDGNPFKVYTDLNGQIVHGAHVKTGHYNKISGVLDIGGKEIIDHFSQRVAVQDYSISTYPSGIDPAILMYNIFNDAQNPTLAGAGASIGLTVQASASALPLLIPGYPLSQLSTVEAIYQALIQVSAPGIGGLDASLTSMWDVNGNPADLLRIWSPRVGRAAGKTGLIFDLSTALDYDWPTDATASGNTIIGTGSGTGNAIPTVTVSAPGVPVGGLGQSPRLDYVANFHNVQSETQLAYMTNGVALQKGRPLVTPTITVLATGTQPLGSWIIGDDVRVYTSGDPRFPYGKDEYWRIVQHTVNVPDQGLATVTVTLNRPPIY
jgi:hypothetical protein